MEYLSLFIDIVLHLDKYIEVLVRDYGNLIYVILFVVIFAETGLVVTPFLPGDSLLFVTGAVAAVGGMDISLLIAVMLTAAVLGNTVNYGIGRYLGPKVFHWEDSRFFNKAALQKTHAFYEKYGGITLITSRFLPIFRTFAPFVAGIGAMNWARYTLYNVIGAAAWVLSLTLAGYWLGNIPWVKQNLTLIILGLLTIPVLPAAIGWWKSRQTA